MVYALMTLPTSRSWLGDLMPERLDTIAMAELSSTRVASRDARDHLR